VCPGVRTAPVPRTHVSCAHGTCSVLGVILMHGGRAVRAMPGDLSPVRSAAQHRPGVSSSRRRRSHVRAVRPCNETWWILDLMPGARTRPARVHAPIPSHYRPRADPFRKATGNCLLDPNRPSFKAIASFCSLAMLIDNQFSAYY
jgi:hypothetical protein